MTTKVIITVPISQENAVMVEAIGNSSEEPIAAEVVLPGQQIAMMVGDSVILNIAEVIQK